MLFARLGVFLEVSGFVDGSSGHPCQDDAGRPSAVPSVGLILAVVLDLLEAFLKEPDDLLDGSGVSPQVASTKPSFDMAVVLDLLEAFLKEPDVLLDGSGVPPQVGSRKPSFDTSRVRSRLLIVLEERLEELLFICFWRSLLDG